MRGPIIRTDRLIPNRPMSRGENVVLTVIPPKRFSAVKVILDFDRNDAKNMLVDHRIAAEVYCRRGDQLSHVAGVGWENKVALPDDEESTAVRITDSSRFAGGDIEIHLNTRSACKCGVNVEFE